jgi:hypothetical protein
MSKGPRLRPTRSTERAGVREVTDFFEANNCGVQPVNGENDFGKDLYVDLTRDVDPVGNAEVTGITCAIQVKTGPSYRTASGYQIPLDQHLHCWRDSTVPVSGIVCDLERSLMVWVNLTEHLRTRHDDLKYVSAPSSSVLNQQALPELCLYLHFQGDDAMDVMTAKLPSYPQFLRHPAFDAVVEHIQMNGYLAMAD